VETVRRDVVIMDIQMPRMNGLEAARRITEKFPDIKIVLVTLHDTPEIRAAARECGARWFVLSTADDDESSTDHSNRDVHHCRESEICVISVTDFSPLFC